MTTDLAELSGEVRTDDLGIASEPSPDRNGRHKRRSKQDKTRKRPAKTAALFAENAVVIDKLDIPLAQTLGQITNLLLTRGDYYHRDGKLVSIMGDDIRAVCTAHELAGELSAIAEVVNVRHKGDNVLQDHVPLPTEYGNCWLNNPLETTRLPKITLFTRNPTYDDSFELVRPGFNARSGIYYAGLKSRPRTPRSTWTNCCGIFAGGRPATGPITLVLS